MSKIIFNELITNMSSAEYHSTIGFSSSQLKTMNEDPELFHKKYISKEIAKEENVPIFDMGTYFHTAILEPHLLKKECAVFQGIRRGVKWDDFQKKNKHKAIITSGEVVQADRLITAVKESEIATFYLKNKKATPEVSTFVKLYAYKNQIYSYYFNKLWTINGWSNVSKTKAIEAKDGGTCLTVKVRADLLGPNYILDLKSMSGNPRVKWSIKNKISDLSYDLSASLYLDIFSLVLGKPMETFIWTFASKDQGICKSYYADEENVAIGRVKSMKAMVKLADCIRKKWVFKDSLEPLEPNYYEREHLNYKPANGKEDT